MRGMAGCPLKQLAVCHPVRDHPHCFTALGGLRVERAGVGMVCLRLRSLRLNPHHKHMPLESGNRKENDLSEG